MRSRLPRSNTGYMAFPLYAVASFETPRPSGTRVLGVRLAGPGGERWSTVGIGETLGEALAWARESAPSGTSWLVSGWAELYGD